MQTIQVPFDPETDWHYVENMANIWGVNLKKLKGNMVEISFSDPVDLFWFAANLNNPFDNV